MTSAEDGRPRWLLLAATLALVGFAWGGTLGLPLTGEDWVMLARIRQGEAGSPHVFRPLSEAWLAGLHGAFGPDAAALHAGSLFLHLANTGLVAVVALELLSSTFAAVVVALLFGLGAGVLDSLAWVAAVNRPLSATGALIAWLGLARLARLAQFAQLAQIEQGARAGLALLLVGLVVQLGANEEAYGTALLALGWLAALSLRRRELWRTAALGSAAVLALVAVHYLALNRIALTPGRLRPSLAHLTHGIATRAEQIAAGFSLPGWMGLALPAAAGLVLFARGRRHVALLGTGAWLAALVPFVLSEPSPYRAYPTQAPTALLVGAAAHALLGSSPRRAARLSAALLIAAAAFAGSELPRRSRIADWQAALAEIRTVERDAQALSTAGGPPPVLVNLEPSSTGPFCYAFGVLDPTELTLRGFLDAASAYEEPGDRPAGAWYGRRFEGSYGWIEPELYFAGRPRVEPLHCYARALAVGSLAEAERALQDPAVDLLTTAVVEAPPEVLAAALAGAGESPQATLEVLAPFEFGVNWARTTVAVRTDRPTLLVYQEHWLFEFLSRLSADQALRTDQTDLRRVALQARDRRTGELATVFRANAYGFAVLLAPGEHELELAWSVRRDE